MLLRNPTTVGGKTEQSASRSPSAALLRKQNGFKDEITFANAGGVDVTAISLWENKTDAEAYNANTYLQVLKTLERFIEGTPKVQTSDVVNSTFHTSAVQVAA